jgi:NAD(P)H-dependent FMN reductase
MSPLVQPSILIVSGTNRPGSNALRISELVLASYRRIGADASIFSLADLPAEIFVPTSYASKPPSFASIQQRVLESGGLHVVTPEYNGSFPGVLKYFIDMLKFPESFEQKPVAFVGEAAGTWGGLRSVEQLQMIFGYRNAWVLPNRVFIPAVHTRFDAEGKFVDGEILKRIDEQADAFAKFITALKG